MNKKYDEALIVGENLKESAKEVWCDTKEKVNEKINEASEYMDEKGEFIKKDLNHLKHTAEEKWH